MAALFRDLRIGLVRIALALCLPLLVAGAVGAQSVSPAEESLRRQLLNYLRSTSSPDVEALKRFYQRPSKIPVQNQPFKESKKIEELGRDLFYDTRLSIDNQMSCATCHNPKLDWVDGLAQSLEGNSRRSMALYNLAWDSRFTWQGAAGSLLSQAVMAMTAKKGMNMDPLALALKFQNDKEYRERFAAAFPERKGAVHPDFIFLAIERYVRTLLSPIAPFDEWVEGKRAALSPEAQRGFLLFHTKARCAQCHNLWRFSDSRVYDIGLVADDNSPDRMAKAVGLRQISKRPPYMHTGAFPTLESVVDFYNQGGHFKRASKSQQIQALGLSKEEKLALVAFLRTLSAGQVS